MLFHSLKRAAPRWLVGAIPASVKNWIKNTIAAGHNTDLGFLVRDLQLPSGETEESLFQYLSGYHLDNSPRDELDGYLKSDFRRFIHTLSLIPAGEGDLLEIGANPYSTSMLIRRFTDYTLHCSNFFGTDHPDIATQFMANEAGDRIAFEFRNFNVEGDDLPFPDDGFDVVLFCEVIEHLTNDPMKALLNIKKILKPRGCLIFTTPNAARLENVAKMLAGKSVFDEYSAYGPYGRHNREFTREEVSQLLEHLGFQIEKCFTSDVRMNEANLHYDLDRFIDLVSARRPELGQHIFIRARNDKAGEAKKPKWLYRSYDL